MNIKYVNRRKGDVSKLICDSNYVKKILNWDAKNSNIKKIVDDEIGWISKFTNSGLERKFKNYLK